MRKSAEGVHVALCTSRPVFDGEVKRLQGGGPPVQQGGTCAHCPEPLQSIMVGEYFERDGRQIGAKFINGPYNGQALYLSGRIVPFGSVQRAGGTADDAFLAILDLCQNGTKADSGCIGVQPKRERKVGVGSGGAGGESLLNLLERPLALIGPFEWGVFPEELVEGGGGGHEVSDEPPVITG